MNWPSKLHFALDIDDLTFSHACCGRDPDRMGKRTFAKRDQGKPIDLADVFAAGVDQQLAAKDLLAISLFDALIASPVLHQGRFDVRTFDSRSAYFRGHII
ncbi:hypothetical protein BKK81_33835 (plasmid) [Cupriavidus sp. USMAHM13]|nr:hypothetical protein BKK81_33835 [Cupriavidus sp. USMAHM13]